MTGLTPEARARLKKRIWQDVQNAKTAGTRVSVYGDEMEALLEAAERAERLEALPLLRAAEIIEAAARRDDGAGLAFQIEVAKSGLPGCREDGISVRNVWRGKMMEKVGIALAIRAALSPDTPEEGPE